MAAPTPRDEQKRLAALEKLRLLSTDAEEAYEEAYEDIVGLAAFICDTPIAAVSLVDAQRQWFKSSLGLNVKETPRDVAFCAHTILQSDLLVIPDTQADPRFADNPLVTGDPNIRFYAGAPLVTGDGHALGSLCVIDRVPRSLTADQQVALKTLARQAADRIELNGRVSLQKQFAAVQAAHLTERIQAAEALRQSEEELRAVVDQAMDGIFIFDFATRRLLKTNIAMRAMLGYSKEQVGSLTLYDIIAHEKQSVDRNLERLALAGEIALGERRYLHRDGSIVVVEVHGRVLRYGGGEAFCVVVHDVTERKQAKVAQGTAEAAQGTAELAQGTAEAAQGAAERNYHALFENALEGIFRSTPQGTFLHANPALARIYGYENPETLIGEMTDISSQLYVDVGRRAQFQSVMWEQGGFSEFESQVYRKDGGIIWISESARLKRDASGGLLWYEGFVQDISERKAQEAQQAKALQEAQERADLDPLTGLLNHRAFHRRLDEEAARAQRENTVFAVVMLDLDNFKFFNDAYGHSTGEEVLRLVAGKLQQVCRSYDTLSRFGGDEFALLLVGIGNVTREEIEARLRADLSGLVCHPAGLESAIPIGASVGVALFPNHSLERGEVLEQADERMRRAKTGGVVETEADQVRLSVLSQVEGFSMLDALVTAVDNKDRYTRKHSEDVLEYCLKIAHGLGLGAAEQQTVAIAALLHDVGKIGVPDAILRKPGKLTEEEFMAVKQHPTMGAAIVSTVPGLEHTLQAVRHHHERWDGQGYPSGLIGEEIPLIARLMAVADAFSAMTTDRPYRKGMDKEKALAILITGAGTQWDPTCVHTFLTALRGDIKGLTTAPKGAANV